MFVCYVKLLQELRSDVEVLRAARAGGGYDAPFGINSFTHVCQFATQLRNAYCILPMVRRTPRWNNLLKLGMVDCVKCWPVTERKVTREALESLSEVLLHMILWGLGLLRDDGQKTEGRHKTSILERKCKQRRLERLVFTLFLNRVNFWQLEYCNNLQY